MTPAELDIDPDERRYADLSDVVRRELDRLTSLLAVAAGAQWTPAPTARPREDTAERSKNAKSDPTAAIALDEGRVALRERVILSERALRNVAITLRVASSGLDTALAPWHGEVPTDVR